MIFDIVVTQSCNLACKYCFEKTKNDVVLSVKNCTKIISFIKSYLDYNFVANRKEVIINFNGGEPLLNFDFIKVFIEQSKDFVTRYSISTNLSVVTKDMLSFLNKYNVTLHVSIDGDKKTNDRNRRDLANRSYYSKLNNNLNLLKKYKGITVSLSMVYTPETVSKLFKNTKMLYKKGYRIINSSYASNYQWETKTVKIIKFQFKKIGYLYIKAYENNVPFYFSIFSDTIKRLINNSRADKCGAFTNEITLLPDGRLIPCLGFLGNELTNLFSYGYWNNYSVVHEKMIEDFRNKVEETEKLCADCALMDYCHKSCILELNRAKNVHNSVSAMNCLINQASFFECEKIIRKLLKKKNESFMKEYKESINNIEVLK